MAYECSTAKIVKTDKGGKCATGSKKIGDKSVNTIIIEKKKLS